MQFAWIENQGRPKEISRPPQSHSGPELLFWDQLQSRRPHAAFGYRGDHPVV